MRVPISERRVRLDPLSGVPVQAADFSAGTDMAGKALQAFGTKIQDSAAMLSKQKGQKAPAAAADAPAPSASALGAGAAPATSPWNRDPDHLGMVGTMEEEVAQNAHNRRDMHYAVQLQARSGADPDAYLLRKGADAIGGTAAAAAEFDEAEKQLSAGIASPQEREKFAANAYVRKTEELRLIARHEVLEIRADTIATARADADISARLAVEKSGDERSFDAHLGDGLGSFNTIASAEGWDKQRLLKEKARYVSDAHGAVVRKWRSEDPRRSQAWLDAHEHEMDPREAERLRRSLKPRLEEIETDEDVRRIEDEVGASTPFGFDESELGDDAHLHEKAATLAESEGWSPDRQARAAAAIDARQARRRSALEEKQRIARRAVNEKVIAAGPGGITSIGQLGPEFDDLSEADEAAHIDWIRNRQGSKDAAPDPLFLASLSDELAADPDKFADRNAAADLARLPRAEHARYLAMRRKALGKTEPGETTQAEHARVVRITKQVVEQAMPIDPSLDDRLRASGESTRSEITLQLRDQMPKRIKEWEGIHGKAATDQDIANIASDVLGELGVGAEADTTGPAQQQQRPGDAAPALHPEDQADASSVGEDPRSRDRSVAGSVTEQDARSGADVSTANLNESNIGLEYAELDAEERAGSDAYDLGGDLAGAVQEKDEAQNLAGGAGTGTVVDAVFRQISDPETDELVTSDPSGNSSPLPELQLAAGPKGTGWGSEWKRFRTRPRARLNSKNPSIKRAQELWGDYGRMILAMRPDRKDESGLVRTIGPSFAPSSDWTKRQLLYFLEQVVIPERLERGQNFGRQKTLNGEIEEAARLALEHRQKLAFEYLTSKAGGAWSAAAAVGIIASLSDESALDPGRRQNDYMGKPGPGSGLAQWDVVEDSRAKRYNGFPGNKNYELDSSFIKSDFHGGREAFYKQLSFVNQELTRPDGNVTLYVTAGNELRATKTFEDATDIVVRLYERSKKQDDDIKRRKEIAKGIWDRFVKKELIRGPKIV